MSYQVAKNTYTCIFNVYYSKRTEHHKIIESNVHRKKETVTDSLLDCQDLIKYIALSSQIILAYIFSDWYAFLTRVSCANNFNMKI